MSITTILVNYRYSCELIEDMLDTLLHNGAVAYVPKMYLELVHLHEKYHKLAKVARSILHIQLRTNIEEAHAAYCKRLEAKEILISNLCMLVVEFKMKFHPIHRFKGAFISLDMVDRLIDYIACIHLR